MASTEQSSGHSPINAVITPAGSSGAQPPPVHPGLTRAASSNFPPQPIPWMTSNMTYEPISAQDHSNLPKDIYNDSGSNFRSEFESSRATGHIRPTSMPPDYSNWSQTPDMVFSMGSASQQMGDFIPPSSVPMDVPLAMYDETVYEQIDDPNIVMTQSAAEWNADLTWNYA
jgi:hypothetical protein